MYNNYMNPYYTAMPTATQPYGFPMPNYTQGATTNPAPYTNLIYVSGVEDARSKPVPAGGVMIFADNDKPLLYKKTVDNKGQFEIETFDITPHKDEAPVESTTFASKTDLEALQKKLSVLEDTVAMLIPTKEAPNGSNS